MIVNTPIMWCMTPPQTPEPVLSIDTLRATGALLSAQTAVGRLIDVEAVAPTGHDPTIVDLLTRLDQAQGNRLRAVELSRQLLMSPSHISRTIDRAGAAGLIERSPDPEDRRASQVCLTAAGRAVVADFAPRLTAIVDRVIRETLTTREVDLLVSLLGRVEEAACQPCPE